MSIERRFCVALRYTLYYGLTLVLVLSAAFVFSANAATLEYGEFIGEYRGNPGQLGNDGVEDLLVATGDSRLPISAPHASSTRPANGTATPRRATAIGGSPATQTAA